mgnify:CR=1 FL=1
MIVNPWIFYLAGICENLGFVAVLIVFVICIYLMVRMIGYYADGMKHWWDKNFKIAAIIGLLFLVLAIIIPSQSTCYKMIIASQVTAENLDKVEDTIERIADYVADKDE